MAKDRPVSQLLRSTMHSSAPHFCSWWTTFSVFFTPSYITCGLFANTGACNTQETQKYAMKFNLLHINLLHLLWHRITHIQYWVSFLNPTGVFCPQAPNLSHSLLPTFPITFHTLPAPVHHKMHSCRGSMVLIIEHLHSLMKNFQHDNYSNWLTYLLC